MFFNSSIELHLLIHRLNISLSENLVFVLLVLGHAISGFDLFGICAIVVFGLGPTIASMNPMPTHLHTFDFGTDAVRVYNKATDGRERKAIKKTSFRGPRHTERAWSVGSSNLGMANPERCGWSLGRVFLCYFSWQETGATFGGLPCFIKLVSKSAQTAFIIHFGAGWLLTAELAFYYTYICRCTCASSSSCVARAASPCEPFDMGHGFRLFCGRQRFDGP